MHFYFRLGDFFRGLALTVLTRRGLGKEREGEDREGEDREGEVRCGDRNGDALGE